MTITPQHLIALPLLIGLDGGGCDAPLRRRNHFLTPRCRSLGLTLLWFRFWFVGRAGMITPLMLTALRFHTGLVLLASLATCTFCLLRGWKL